MIRNVVASLLLVLAVTGCEGRLHGTPVEPPKQMPTFEFRTADGSTYSTAPQAGKPMLVFFGYTRCPDVCPVTLANWARIRTALGADASQVRFLFVSVDRERDTPQSAQDYASGFDKAFTGVVGDSATTAAIEREFMIASYIEPSPSGHTEHLVNHSTRTFLVDARGQLRAMYSSDIPWEHIISDIETVR